MDHEVRFGPICHHKGRYATSRTRLGNLDAKQRLRIPEGCLCDFLERDAFQLRDDPRDLTRRRGLVAGLDSFARRPSLLLDCAVRCVERLEVRVRFGGGEGRKDGGGRVGGPDFAPARATVVSGQSGD